MAGRCLCFDKPRPPGFVGHPSPLPPIDKACLPPMNAGREEPQEELQLPQRNLRSGGRSSASAHDATAREWWNINWNSWVGLSHFPGVAPSMHGPVCRTAMSPYTQCVSFDVISSDAGWGRAGASIPPPSTHRRRYRHRQDPASGGPLPHCVDAATEPPRAIHHHRQPPQLVSLLSATLKNDSVYNLADTHSAAVDNNAGSYHGDGVRVDNAHGAAADCVTAPPTQPVANFSG